MRDHNDKGHGTLAIPMGKRVTILTCTIRRVCVAYVHAIAAVIADYTLAPINKTRSRAGLKFRDTDTSIIT